MIVLTLSVMTGCSNRTQYVTVEPECQVPPQPALPTIKGKALSGLADDVYWDLETREKRLTDWALEMREMLREICGEGGSP